MQGWGPTRLFPTFQIRLATPERHLYLKRGIIVFSNRPELSARLPRPPRWFIAVLDAELAELEKAIREARGCRHIGNTTYCN